MPNRRQLKTTIILIVFSLMLFGFVGNGVQASEYTIRIAHCMPTNHPYHKACQEFQEVLSEKTNGRLKVIIYPQEQLGTEQDITELVSAGQLEMGCVWSGTFEQFYPSTAVTQLPYLFDSWEHYWQVIDSEIGEEIFKPLKEDDILVLPSFVNGLYNLLSTKEIREPKDLKGAKFRIAPSAILSVMFTNYGVIVSPMPFGEVYTALQMRTIDGDFQNSVNAWSNSFHEVAGYITEVEACYFMQSLIMNGSFYNRLSEEDQKAIKEAALEAAIWQRNNHQEAIADAVRLLKENGMEYIAVDKEIWRESVQPVYDHFYKKYPQWENIVKEIRDFGK
jgi:tripartite ATP-independent transporter DctP family solute receptor